MCQATAYIALCKFILVHSSAGLEGLSQACLGSESDIAGWLEAIQDYAQPMEEASGVASEMGPVRNLQWEVRIPQCEGALCMVQGAGGAGGKSL